MEKFQMWIGGKWIGAASGKTYRALNPATEKEIAEIPLGDKTDVDKAVAAARKAFPFWSRTPQSERSRAVEHLAALQREYAAELTRLEILDHGTPIKLARMQSLISSGNLEYTAQAARALMGSTIPSSPNNLFHIQREPIGVAALIIP